MAKFWKGGKNFHGKCKNDEVFDTQAKMTKFLTEE